MMRVQCDSKPAVNKYVGNVYFDVSNTHQCNSLRRKNDSIQWLDEVNKEWSGITVLEIVWLADEKRWRIFTAALL